MRPAGSFGAASSRLKFGEASLAETVCGDSIGANLLLVAYGSPLNE